MLLVTAKGLAAAAVLAVVPDGTVLILREGLLSTIDLGTLAGVLADCQWISG